MSRLGEYALLVVRSDSAGEDPQVVGLITIFDIYRLEKLRSELPPLRQTHDVSVEAVMTPWFELPLVKYESLHLLTMPDLVEMFTGTERTHLLVIESGDRRDQAIARGLIARCTLAKRIRRRNRR